MTLTFLTAGTGQPFLRLDARTGQFLLSEAEGDPTPTDLKGKVLTLDLARAVQGWLKLSRDGADWVPISQPGVWADRPSAEHKDGVSVMVQCAEWPAPQVREFRGHSRAITSFIGSVSAQAGEIPAGKAPRVMINGVKTKTYPGGGSSVDIEFELAPRDRWADAGIFDEHPMDAIKDSDIDVDTVPTPKSKWA